MVFIVYFYNFFIAKMSGIEAIFFSLPFIIVAIIILGNVLPSVLKKAKGDLKFLIEFFFKK